MGSREGLRLPPDSELSEEFLRPASGPGGQHLNKTSNAVRLSFHFERDSFLPPYAKARLRVIGGCRVSGGVLTILSKDSRSLADNRRVARERLSELVAEAMKRPKPRKATKPTRASKDRRIKAKSVRSRTKQGRRSPHDFD